MTRLVVSVMLALLLNSSCKQESLHDEQEYEAMLASVSPQISCIDGLVDHLGIDIHMESDPVVMRTVLKDEMLLDDLDSVNTLLNVALLTPINLQPMLEEIRNAIATQHPAISKFLCAAKASNLFPLMNESSRQIVTRLIHHTYILDRLTEAMFQDWKFMVELRKHLSKKRNEAGIRTEGIGAAIDLYSTTGEIFEPMKTITMDWVFSEYERIREQGYIPPSDVTSRQNGLVINIVEAVVTDRSKGFRNNALTGVALAVTPPEQVLIKTPGNFFEYPLSQSWTSLYETWNMAFITGNMPNLNILYPKLLIPRVIAAKHNAYLFNRALSLWLAINFDLFAKTRGEHLELPNAKALAKLWGDINIDYAQDFFRTRKERNLRGFSELLSIPFDLVQRHINNKRAAEE